MTDYYFIIAFNSIHDAIKAEDFFEKNNIKVKLIPTPSIISQGCGLSIKVLPSEVLIIKSFINNPIFNKAKFYKMIKGEAQLNKYLE